MALLLEAQGLEVITAPSFTLGHALLKRHASDLDALVTDFDLGDGFGDALVQLAEEHGIPALVLTGLDPATLPRDLDVLRKPVDFDAFVAHLEGRLRRSVPARAAVRREPTVAGEAPPQRPTLDLALFVAGDTAACRRARKAVQQVADRLGPRIALTVVDLERHPEQVQPEDRVVFTPTLVRRSPTPRAWLIGEVAGNLDQLLDTEA